MIFMSLILANFMSWASLEVDLLQTGLLLLLGANGTGKSNLIEAICWCLSSQTVKEVAAHEVVHNKVPHLTKPL